MVHKGVSRHIAGVNQPDGLGEFGLHVSGEDIVQCELGVYMKHHVQVGESKVKIQHQYPKSQFG